MICRIPLKEGGTKRKKSSKDELNNVKHKYAFGNSLDIAKISIVAVPWYSARDETKNITEECDSIVHE
jgi:hypothetical protein